MNKLFNFIGEKIEKNPVKILLSTILVFILLIVGAFNVKMATGNETLVDKNNDVFKSNEAMEENFGGDSIIVMFEAENEKDLLSIENIEKMWNVEKKFENEENIFSFMSPASITNQMTDMQSKEIKSRVSDISGGLDEMSLKLIEIGTELGNKDMPSPDEIEKKLDSLMKNMDPDKLMQNMLKDQEVEMTKMTGEVSKVSGGLAEMGSRLTAIGSDLASKDVPNPKEIEKKLDNLMKTIDPDKLMEEMLGEQEAEMAAMEQKVGQMSSQLSEMGSGLITMGTNLQNIESLDMSNIQNKLKELENISAAFDSLILGQDNLGAGITELGGGLSNSSNGLSGFANQLKQMANQKDNPELKSQLNEISENIRASSEALGTMSGKTNQLKEVPTKTSTGLDNIKLNLEKEINEMKASLPQGIPAGQLKEMSANLINMGNGLNKFSTNISNLPGEIGGSLGDAPSKMISDMMAKMEKEITGMKSNLSGGISPDELKTMSSGFTTMGKNLTEMSGGISNLPNELSGALSGGGDPSSIFADMTSQIETEVENMKLGLSGGIDPDELKTMAAGFVTMGENLADISKGLSTFHSKSGMMISNIPENQEELDNLLYDEDGKLRTIFSDVVVDDNHSVMMIKLDGNLDDEYKDAIYEDLSLALEKEEFKSIGYTVSGKPVLDTSLRSEMKSNMQVMVAMAVVIMFIILLLVFKIRWRTLSLGIIFVSVIATLGFMGTLNVPMTMVSMAVFPILIGLGIDYSIQFQNRYEEEKSAKVTLRHIGKAVGIAVLATVLGFISLYASPVPMIKDFGKMLTIGVIISFIGSVFLLMPILHLRDTFGEKENKDKKLLNEKETFIEKGLYKTTKFVVKHSIAVIVIAIVIASMGVAVDSKVGVETDIETFMPQDMEALADIHEIRDILGSTNQMAIYMEDDNILSEKNVSWMNRTRGSIESKYSDVVVDIKSIDSVVGNISEGENLSYKEYIDTVNDLPKEQRKMFVNEDSDKAVILLNVSHLSTEDMQSFVEELKEDLKDAPMNVSVTGKSVLDVEMVEGLTEGRVKMTFLGIALVFLVLLIIYRNVFKAFIAVFPIILIIGMSSGIMYLLGLSYTPITATLGALVLGMGTEMTIMLLERYVEERKQGIEKLDAMLITVRKIGKATVASGLTTIGGFSVLMASKFVILKDFGLMTVINISLALISTFIILPAVLVLMDKFIINKNDIKIGREKSSESLEGNYEKL